MQNALDNIYASYETPWFRDMLEFYTVETSFHLAGEALHVEGFEKLENGFHISLSGKDLLEIMNTTIEDEAFLLEQGKANRDPIFDPPANYL